DIYPEGYSTYIEETDLSKGLCGATRPGHFRGVTTVVAKLFNIVQPDSAFFGRKDYQQLCVIKKMVKDLNIPIRIIGCPIVREDDGLAMSSRNKNLNPDERKEALCLRRALLRAEELVGAGEKDAAVIRESMVNIIEKEPSARIDYIEIRDGETLELVDRVEEGTLIALAVFIGKTRLIDNILI
ncbi:MAG TPA: 4-phosphopantoate--beta-alanine ligase, partial [Proteobacteria bacterium]|nr:4-phosphopantoate--beta-alanine ligase [Pseudomonadota bacterium]